MNIFFLDKDPEMAAKYHCDKHRNKMITESVQMLSTAHRVLLGQKRIVLSDNGRRMTRYVFDDQREQDFMKDTHVNHPSAVWVRSGHNNYKWLVLLVCYLNEEFKKFSKKDHAAYLRMVSSGLNMPPEKISVSNFTEPPPTMPDEYKVSGDSVKSYRNFYIHDKSRFATFKQGYPDWYLKGIYEKDYGSLTLLKQQ